MKSSKDNLIEVTEVFTYQLGCQDPDLIKAQGNIRHIIERAIRNSVSKNKQVICGTTKAR
jgi:hypothetical protein